jgi:hypothetical protein
VFLDVPGVVADVGGLIGNMLENGGGVLGGLTGNDCSGFDDTGVGVSDCGGTGVVGVKGGVGAMVVDEIETGRCILERECGDSKFVVDIESRVDVEPPFSDPFGVSYPSSEMGFRCVIWKSAWGGSEPKTCDMEKVNWGLGSVVDQRAPVASFWPYGRS